MAAGSRLPAMMWPMPAGDDRETPSRPILIRIVRITAWVGGVALVLFVLAAAQATHVPVPRATVPEVFGPLAADAIAKLTFCPLG